MSRVIIRCMATRNRRRRDVLSAEAVELIAERFRILGEPIRIRILQELENGERNVSDLVAAVGSSQPNVSKHLRILQESGVVGRRQEGNNVYYAIADPAVIDLCDAVCSSLRERLASAVKLAAELGRR
ncbi:MAG TPA: metalloregulator ArsR/SmtB family transcription factor [Thermoanaerobaculia bacterium]|nr:metalloregulator ArsR/SmtB family transcription factor [Thermoanaerobaculia bacterium]